MTLGLEGGFDLMCVVAWESVERRGKDGAGLFVVRGVVE